MPIIGIDADSRQLPYAVIVDNAVESVQTIVRSNSHGRFDERYWIELTRLVRSAQEWGAVIYLESIYLPADGVESRNVATFEALAKVHGEIEHEARKHRVPIEKAEPSTWRMYVLGENRGGSALKAMAMKTAAEYWAKAMTEHEAEAVCIAIFGDRREKERTKGAVRK